MRRGRLTAGAVAASVLLVVLTGCAPERDLDWEPAVWPDSAAVLVSAPAATGADAGAGVGMRVRNDTVRIDARWTVLPGAHPVNDAILNIVKNAVAEQELISQAAYRPHAMSAADGIGERGCAPGMTEIEAAELLGTAEAAHTVVVCEIVQAAGDVFGERVRVVRGSASGVLADVTTTVYADMHTGEVATARELFAAPAELWDDVVELLRREAGSLSVRTLGTPTPDQLALLEPALADARFVKDSVVLRLPVGFTAPALQGVTTVPASTPMQPVYIALPYSAAAGALTPFGRAVATAAGPAAYPAGTNAPVDCTLLPCLALTLDDGPGALTPGILDVLRARGAAATFYMLGQNARQYPDIVRRVAAEGHQIGNHTWNHPYLPQLDDAAIRSQLGDTARILRELSGQPVATFRPPGGFIDNRVVALAGQPAVMWSIDTRDWAGVSDADLLRYTIDAPAPGAIVLMHDIQPATARIFDDVVAGLHDRGFTLVTIDALFGGAVPSGIVRRGR